MPNGLLAEAQPALRIRKKLTTKLSADRRMRALHFIEANLHKNISLADIAEAAAMSRFHFNRSFKVSMGTTPMKYLVERRLTRAKSHMACLRKALVDISHECGFGSQSCFTTAFRLANGDPPAAWRAKNVAQACEAACVEKCLMLQGN